MARATPRDDVSPPPHHRPDGGFRIPWPILPAPPTEHEPSRRDIRRWILRQLFRGGEGPAASGTIPRGVPDVARPAAPPGALRVTWIGHATFLVQIGCLNVLTDPVWSRRASPFSWFGPKRFTKPGLALTDLPPVHAVVLSHDHYDHLDHATVRALVRRHPDAHWVSPLGYAPWLRRRGARTVTELDWWESITLGSAPGAVRFTAVPAQHWTRRRPWDTHRRLWAAWVLAPEAGPRFFYGGDSGYFPGYTEIGDRLGPFGVVALPIGAYAPRSFMRVSHMNPEEAVRAYHDLGGSGAFLAMHWGAFRLSMEPPLEPPERLAAAWRRAGLPEDRLWIPGIGESRSL